MVYVQAGLCPFFSEMAAKSGKAADRTGCFISAPTKNAPTCGAFFVGVQTEKD
jgi:hypothetical protein